MPQIHNDAQTQQHEASTEAGTAPKGLQRYFVHRYDVVRVKVAVEAEDHAGAMKAADDYLGKHHPIRNAYYDANSDDQELADRLSLPAWIHYEEPGQEVTGYLVDEFDDPEHEKTAEYESDGTPINHGATEGVTVELNSSAELNTVIAALFHYLKEGLGDPAKRSDEVNSIAIGQAFGLKEEVSLDQVAVNALTRSIWSRAAKAQKS